MSFTQSLDQLKQGVIANTPADAYNELQRLIREQQQAGREYGLMEGEKAKDFTLKNPLGETVNLFDKLSQGPVVLTFQNIFLNQFNLNLAEYNATNLWILPIPSTFMIDESGIIRSAYVEPYFMKRPDPENILERLRQL